MPTVPVITRNSVDAAPRPVGAVQPVRNPMGEAVGEGLRDLGRATQGYAEAQDRLNLELDDTGARTLVLGMQGELTEPLTGFLASEGFDAMNATEGVKKRVADARSAYAAKATSGRMRKLFEQAVAPIEQGYIAQIGEHSIKQLKGQQVVVAKGEQAQYRESALSNWSDPAAFTDNLTKGIAAVEAEAKVHGVQGVALDVAKRDYVSTTRKMVIGQLLAQNKADDAIGYATVHRGDFNSDDLASIDKALQEPLEMRFGIEKVAAINGLNAPLNSPSGKGVVLAPGTMFSKGIVPIEGGTGARGQFLTSPKGAIGPAQVMPGTAKEAAALAGLPFDEKRYRTDAAYNLALGNAYFAKQLSDFGDPLMAAAAYNAGPGSARRGTGVRGAIAKAKARGGAWRDYLPAETKGYIERFGARIGATAGAVPNDGLDEASAYARLDTMAKAEGWTPEQRRVVETELDRVINRQRSVVTARQSDAKDAALQWVVANGDTFTSTTAVPRAIWDNLAPETQLTLTTRAQTNGTSTAIKPNSIDAMRLDALKAGDPDAFLKLDLSSYVGKVTAAELSSAVQEQARMRGPLGDKILQTRSAISTSINNQIAFDPAMRKLLNIKDNPEAFARVARDMESYVNSITAGKREPTGQEIDAAWKRAIMPVSMPSGSLFGGTESAPRFKADGKYQVSMPQAVRDRIVVSWRKNHGGADPPDGVIGDIYVQNKGKPGYWK